MIQYSLTHLDDALLIRGLKTLLETEREVTAKLLAHIAEVDARRLYVPAGYSSMFIYCVEELRLSEDAAAKRLHAARAARRFPILFDAVSDGRLHLTAVRLIAPHLTSQNVAELVEAATHRRKSEVEEFLAGRFPMSMSGTANGSLVRALPQKASIPAASSPDALGDAARGGPLMPLFGTEVGGGVRPNVPDPTDPEHAPGHVDVASRPADRPTEHNAVQTDTEVLAEREHARHEAMQSSHRDQATAAPIPPPRFLVQVNIDKLTHDRLRYAQALLSHAVPPKDLAQLFRLALEALIEKHEKRKLGTGPRPRSTVAASGVKPKRRVRPRYVPAPVRRAVWERDHGRCTFVGTGGHRCGERRYLEFDHVDPVALGGKPTIQGLRLRCRAHNQHEAERIFGSDFMHSKRIRSKRRRKPQNSTGNDLALGTRAPHTKANPDPQEMETAGINPDAASSSGTSQGSDPLQGP